MGDEDNGERKEWEKREESYISVEGKRSEKVAMRAGETVLSVGEGVSR